MMDSLLKVISETSLPTLLVGAGLVFIFLSFADKVSGQFTISERHKPHALFAGVVLLLAGIGFKVFEASVLDGRDPALAATTGGARNGAALPHQVFRASFDCTGYIVRPREQRTVQEDVLCRYESPARADRELGDHYRSLLEAVVPGDKPALRREQRDWLMQRDFRCRGSWDDLESERPPMQLIHCLETDTRERTKVLAKMLELASTSRTQVSENDPPQQ